MQSAGSPNRYESLIMYIVILMIGLPFMLAVWGNMNTEVSKKLSEPVFDTLKIPGYTFFSQQGLRITPGTDTALFAAVYRHIGIPHISRAGSNGLDCSGLVKRIFNQVYGIKIRGGSHDIYHSAISIGIEDLCEGDLVFFRIRSARINHVGIYVGFGKFVHTSTRSGVRINDLSEPYYQRFFYGAARINRKH